MPPSTALPPNPIQVIRVLSVIPPMTQLNTPYPSTAYLTGFLRSRGIAAVQAPPDLGADPDGASAPHTTTTTAGD